MSKSRSFIKKGLKAILWVVVSVLLLLLLLAVFIQIPAIQTKIIQTVTTYIAGKTHTKVEIKRVSIAFPKSVVVEGIFLEDQHKDTLVYVGNLTSDISLLDLLYHKITVSSVVFKDLQLNLYNTETDSLFNYNFLISAFADSTPSSKADNTTTSPWTFSLGEVRLNNIHLSYQDIYEGMKINILLKNLKLKMDKLDLANSIYGIDELLVDRLNANMLITKPQQSSDNKSGSKSTDVLPKITAHYIQIENTVISYGNETIEESLMANIKQFELKNAHVDLETALVNLDKISLAKSSIQLITGNNVLPSDTIIATSADTPERDWKVKVKSILLNDNTIAYQKGKEKERSGVFDQDNLEYKHLTFIGTDLDYSTEKIRLSINEFSTVDQNGFSIAQFATDFSMDQHAVSMNKLKINTTHSSILGDINLSFTSLQSIKDSLPFLMLDIDLQKASLSNSDILYFSPQLAEQPFFTDRAMQTTLSGTISGSVNHLTGKKIKLTTGSKTSLQTDFSISGLPEVKTARFTLPNLSLRTGKRDLELMAGSVLPQNLALPQDIDLSIDFQGSINDFKSTISLSSSFGTTQLFATVDEKENFSGQVSLDQFDVGKLLNDTAMLGPISLSLEITGQGMDLKHLQANISGEVSSFYLNHYTYHDLKIDGKAGSEQFEGKISLNDENIVFDFDGLLNLNPESSQMKLTLDLKGADLKKLHITPDDIQIGMKVTADLSGNSVNSINGNVAMTNLIVVNDGTAINMDSLLVTSVNENNRSELKIRSPLFGLNYSGTVSPAELPATMAEFFNGYFQFSDSIDQSTEPVLFDFEIQLHNHPLLTQTLFPKLIEFEPGIIQGSFNSDSKNLKMTATINRVVYGTFEVDNLAINVNSDPTALDYKISCLNINNPQFKVDNLIVDGKIADNLIQTTLSSTDDQQNKKLLIATQLDKYKTNYRLKLDPQDFYLMNERWNIAPDNYILVGEQGFLIHDLRLSKSTSQISITSVNDKFNDDLNIAINNFRINDIFGIIEQDTNMVQGTANGNILLKRVHDSYGIIADTRIDQLTVSDILVGNLSLKGENRDTERFDLHVSLSGAENNLTSDGYFILAEGNNTMNIKTEIPSFSMKTIQAFSMGQITEASGIMTGHILVNGNIDVPDISGELVFNNTFINPAALNNQIELKHETLQFKNDGIYFNAFTLLDINKHSAVIDGSVKMKKFKDFVFDLQVNTTDFLLVNTTSANNKEFFGKMVIDSKINIKGPLLLPVIKANLKVKDGSNFTFAVPESRLTTNTGKGVVEFLNHSRVNAILARGEKIQTQNSSITGIDLTSIIEIDKLARLRVLMDPNSTDSLVVQGEAALSFSMDRSGKMSLTGAYQLTDGSYVVSLESIIKKRFVINKGSTIIWNGDPMDAGISIDAIYSVRASPINLVADQMSGVSDANKNAYKQRYTFLVILKVRGEILNPEISFEIQLPTDDKGILGGAVDAKLALLNQDPSELNKQVFALLVLGRFVQENPLEIGTDDGTSAMLRSTVSSFLSAELNKWSSKLVPGVELNFDVNSYNDYESNQAIGRTQVDIGLKKQLFDERLTVQIGGVVDVEGAKAKQNSVSDITSDVSVEYELTKDGRYRLIGFSHNTYEGTIEGQIVETGVGIIYQRDFERWKDFFKALNR